ncbi:hypothetical protein [Microbacterium sp. IEGM 1404]|uniref:hypothetical protein n=1 Tax=Microbacterium sp. IEGM 1404 TaxID=3047084 RepID=UPI0024B6BE4F|nr:hypothetical protein [Microbacterium sp. IEGM 1404]MDI9891661.1 hypothetical protein [Microbacterium sp. IEGM 1404]
MPWRIYGPALIAALPLGAGMGAVLGSTLTWTGWGSLGAFVVSGAVFGAASAMLGAAGAIVGVSRAVRRGQHAVIPAAVAGTAVGVASLWVLLLAYVAIIAGASVLLVLVPAVLLGALASAVAAAVCAALMAGCRALDRRRNPPPLLPGAAG